MVLFVRPHRERDKKLAEEQVVRVWHKNGNEYETLVALIDTGCDENLILDSVVGKLGLDKMKTVLRPLKGINGQIVKVSELVQPCWKFEEGSRRHQEFRFFIVSNLPGPSMVLGNIAREELGIHLRIASKALIAHGDPEGSIYLFSLQMTSSITNTSAHTDLSTLEQQQQKHNEAAHDATESQSRRRQMIAAQRAETYQRVAAANTTKTTMTQQGSTSQKDAAGSGSKKQ